MILKFNFSKTLLSIVAVAALGYGGLWAQPSTSYGTTQTGDVGKGGDRTNVYFGRHAGMKNTTGVRNSYIGTGSGVNRTGGDNTAVGWCSGLGIAGDTNTGTSNVFVGSRAGFSTTTGSTNVFTGMGAGNKNKTGNGNVYIGYQAGLNNVDGSGNVFIGYKAGIGYSSTTGLLVIHNKGDGEPLISGSFIDKSLRFRSSLTVEGPTNIKNPLDVLGKITLRGTPSGPALLQVYGSAQKPGGGSWSATSDARLKKDVRPFTDGLEKLLQIKPVHFRYNGKADMPTDKEYIGIIAQEMQKIAPYTIDSFTYKDKDGSETEYLKYDSTALSYILVNAIKEQQQIIDNQKDKMAAQQQRIEMLEAQQKEIASLKEMVYDLVSASKKAPDTNGLRAAVDKK